jgi:hypothetical protein
LMIFIVLISIFNYEILGNLYVNYIDIYFPRYRPYNSVNSGWFDGYMRVPITQIVAFIICFYIGNFQNKYNVNTNFTLLLNITMLSFLILAISPFPRINSRIYLYFLPVYFILIAIFSNYFKLYKLFFIILVAFSYFISNYV